jgi:Tol biopolymer transport system component
MKIRAFALVSSVAAILAGPGQAQPPQNLSPVPGTNTDPGGEAAVRRVIDGFIRNQPAFDDMAPNLADVVRRTGPRREAMFAQLGALKGVAFKNAEGAFDLYQADFEHGQLEFRIGSGPGGKPVAVGFGMLPPDGQPARPRPGANPHVMPVSWPVLKLTPRFVTQGANDTGPCFSPDGRTILFSRINERGQAALYLVPVAGGEARLLPGIPASVSASRPAWSAKGMIAFTGMTGGQSAIWVVGPDGSNAHPVPTPMDGSQQLIYPSWYPDGAHLAAMDSKNLVIRRIDLATGATALATDRAQVLTGMPSVSPDGVLIAFAGQRNTGQPYIQEENVIWLVDAAGKLSTLETAPIQGRAPVWSPDGQYLSFESDRGPDGRYAIFIIRRDGTGLTQVTDYALNATHGVFSPDGRHMVFMAGEPAARQTRVAIVDLPER